jgi:endo-1,4-beta-xylanase
MTLDFPGATRREAIAAMLAAPLAGAIGNAAMAASSHPLMPGPGSLQAIAASKGRRFGSSIGSFPGHPHGATVQSAAYANLVATECGIIVPENEFKWAAMRPDADHFAFARMDSIAAFAHRRGLALRGHTLLWHRPKWFPKWLNDYDFGANPSAEAERLLTTHIKTMIGRYGSFIRSYDVVNEAIDLETNGLMQTSLSRAMGGAEAVLDLAFHTAREAAPSAQLVYNDYMSWEPSNRAHCSNVLRLLEGFRKRGTPVDALGVQSHIEMFSIDPGTGVGPYLETEWRRFLDEVTAMGYKLLITEFDVKDKALPSNIPYRDAKVADFARRYLDVMLSYPNLHDVLVWGMVDKYNWLQGFAPRGDGLEVRGCPYDDFGKAKPLRAAIARALENAVPASPVS